MLVFAGFVYRCAFGLLDEFLLVFCLVDIGSFYVLGDAICLVDFVFEFCLLATVF